MAFFYTHHRSNISRKMLAGDQDKILQRWLAFCKFAKTSNGYWLAWHTDSLEKIAVLTPSHPNNEPCEWLWNASSVEAAVDLVESGKYAELPAWERSRTRIKPLRPELEARIRACYPHGQLAMINVEPCDFSYIKPIQQELSACLSKLGASFEYREFNIWSGLERIAEARIMLDSLPDIPWRERLQWAKQTGLTYVHCRITLSTVFPAYILKFGIWRPDSDEVNGVSMNQYAETPWNEMSVLIASCCAKHGLAQLSEDELSQPVPFITEGIFTNNDEDDGDINLMKDIHDSDEGMAAYLRSLKQNKCSVYCCLFQPY